MPPTFDVYVWVDSADPVDVLSRFIDRYVDVDQPGDPRFDAFFRTFVLEQPHPEDPAALAELRHEKSPEGAFSLYLRASCSKTSCVCPGAGLSVVRGRAWCRATRPRST